MKYRFLSGLYKNIRLNKLSSWVFDLFIMGMIFFAVTSWQTKDLISTKEQAPNVELTSLSEI